MPAPCAPTQPLPVVTTAPDFTLLDPRIPGYTIGGWYLDQGLFLAAYVQTGPFYGVCSWVWV